MNSKNKFLVLTVFLLLFAFLSGGFNLNLIGSPQVVLAQEGAESQAEGENNFSVNLSTTYDVGSNGETRVTHHFIISNLNPTLFIKQYGLKLSSSEIQNVVTRDNSGEEISTEVVTTNNQTSIGITFPDQIVGQSKARDFTISYTNPDIAVISGQVLEVSIPKQANPDEFSKHSITILTPLAYGLPTRATPDDYETKLTPDSRKIVTTFTDLGGESVSLIFGESQIFELDIRYSLENPTNTAKISQIALPPDTTYQRVNYNSINPLPDKIERDIDGNWIATYRLEPNSATEVNAHLQVLLSLFADSSVPIMTPNNNLIRPDRYWQSDNNQIQEIAKDYSDVKGLYDYVTGALEYDFSIISPEVERLGALGALSNPEKALCQEFTDLFVSLARAKNIPARRITGYAHTQNEVLRPLSFVEDILHAWPEYYDAQTNLWVPIDPTWENTSGGVDYFSQFDLNHIVFAINGTSSTLPYPAGSYKLENTESKDIQVKFGNQFIPVRPELEFKMESKKIATLPVPGSGRLTVFNRTGMGHYNLDLNIKPDSPKTNLTLQSQNLNYILPFERKEVKINAYADGFFWPYTDHLNITYNEKTSRVGITVSPSVFSYLENPYIVLGMGAGFVTLALITGSILVFWGRRRNSVRRKSKKTKV